VAIWRVVRPVSVLMCWWCCLQLTDEEKAFLDSSRELMAKFESADKAIGEPLVPALGDSSTACNKFVGLVDLCRCFETDFHDATIQLVQHVVLNPIYATIEKTETKKRKQHHEYVPHVAHA